MSLKCKLNRDESSPSFPSKTVSLSIVEFRSGVSVLWLQKGEFCVSIYFVVMMVVLIINLCRRWSMVLCLWMSSLTFVRQCAFSACGLQLASYLHFCSPCYVNHLNTSGIFTKCSISKRSSSKNIKEHVRSVFNYLKWLLIRNNCSWKTVALSHRTVALTLGEALALCSQSSSHSQIHGGNRLSHLLQCAKVKRRTEMSFSGVLRCPIKWPV